MKQVWGEEEIRAVTKELHEAALELDGVLAAQRTKARMETQILAYKKTMAEADWLTAKIEEALQRESSGLDPHTREKAAECMRKAHELFLRSCELLFGRLCVSLLATALKAGVKESFLPLHESRIARLSAVLAGMASQTPQHKERPEWKSTRAVFLHQPEVLLPQGDGVQPVRQNKPNKLDCGAQHPRKSFLNRWLHPGPNIAIGERAMRRYAR